MHNKKILVVDDEESIRNLLKRFLGKYYTVLEAENGEVAVEIAIRKKPDLILMDILLTREEQDNYWDPSPSVPGIDQ